MGEGGSRALLTRWKVEEAKDTGLRQRRIWVAVMGALEALGGCATLFDAL